MRVKVNKRGIFIGILLIIFGLFSPYLFKDFSGKYQLMFFLGIVGVFFITTSSKGKTVKQIMTKEDIYSHGPLKYYPFKLDWMVLLVLVGGLLLLWIFGWFILRDI